MKKVILFNHGGKTKVLSTPNGTDAELDAITLPPGSSAVQRFVENAAQVIAALTPPVIPPADRVQQGINANVIVKALVKRQAQVEGITPAQLMAELEPFLD